MSSLFLIFGSCGNREDMGKPGETWPSITDDGAWCWFADPRAVYYEGSSRNTYIGWVNRAGDIVAAAYNHEDKSIRTTAVREKLQADDHANPAFFILPDGRIMIFYSAHNGDRMYCRISERPEDISSWGKEIEIGAGEKDRFGFTYPNPVRLSRENNRLYLFCRATDFKPCYTISEDGGVTWAPIRQLIQGSGARPYVKIASDGVETIHFAFTDGHPNVEPQNSIYYACYRKEAVYRADGALIAKMEDVPFNPLAADTVFDGRAFGIRAWIWDIALDPNGSPVIVYSSLPAPDNHRYHYARREDGRWKNYEIAAAGKWFPDTPEGTKEREPEYSGGISLDHNNPSILYLSREIDGVFEIEKRTTPDGGATWLAEAVTAGSKKNNVRPFVARGHSSEGPVLFWMYGNYVHWTDFDTAIKMK